MGRMHEFWGALEAYESGATCEHPPEAIRSVEDGIHIDRVCGDCGEKVA